MYKRGGKNRNWKLRYFQIVDKKICYYHDINKLDVPLGFIEIIKIQKIENRPTGLALFFYLNNWISAKIKYLNHPKKIIFDSLPFLILKILLTTIIKKTEKGEFPFDMITPERIFHLKTKDNKMRLTWVSSLSIYLKLDGDPEEIIEGEVNFTFF